MPPPKLSKLEFQIMETLWGKDECSIREIQEAFPAKKRPAYTTIQTTVYRLLKGHKLPAFQVGSDWRFNREEIRRWMMNQQRSG